MCLGDAYLEGKSFKEPDLTQELSAERAEQELRDPAPMSDERLPTVVQSKRSSTSVHSQS